MSNGKKKLKGKTILTTSVSTKEKIEVKVEKQQTWLKVGVADVIVEETASVGVHLFTCRHPLLISAIVEIGLFQ